jgi:DNA-binding CsgD family transcriptional regulator
VVVRGKNRNTRARRAPRLAVYEPAQRPKPTVRDNNDEKARRPAPFLPASVDETLKIFSRHTEWGNIKEKFAARVRAAGVPENYVEGVTDAAFRRLLECKRKGVDIETAKWTLAWDIVEKYIFPDLSERKRKRFRLYAERIGTIGLTPRERQISFYVVWGLGNKEIAYKIGTQKDNVNKHVQKIRRKLGIDLVGLDDRLATVLNLLGL